MADLTNESLDSQHLLLNDIGMAVDMSVEYQFDDEAFLSRMMRFGNSFEVAMYNLSEKKHRLMHEFDEKNAILGSHYEPIAVYDFLEDLFPGQEEYMVITSGDGVENGKGTYAVMDADDLVRYQASRSDVFVPPCSFINRYYSRGTCGNVYAFIIDVDNVKPEVLKNIIEKRVIGGSVCEPSMIVNSGSGIHLYYELEKPIPYFKKNREALDDVYKHLFIQVKKNVAAKADWHSLIQPFRLPGAMTKLGQIAAAYRVGEKWRIQDLAKEVGASVDVTLIQTEIKSQDEYNREQEEKNTGKVCPKCGKRLFYRTNQAGMQFIGCEGYPDCTYKTTIEGEEIKKKKKVRTRVNADFYEACLENVREKTPIGRRYLAMVGLVMVAYKTGVSKEKVEEDLFGLVGHFNDMGATFKTGEVKKALRAYNHRALRTRSATLEDYFGWEFKRRGEWIKEDREKYYANEQERLYKFTEERKKPLIEAGAIDDEGNIISRRKYSLYQARKTRDRNQEDYGTRWDENSGRKSKEEQVKEWRDLHPEGKKIECHRELGISRTTIDKWWE